MARGRPVHCPYCKSTKVVSKGHRKTTTMGLRPLRQCKSCGRRFTKTDKKAAATKKTSPKKKDS